MGNAESQGPPPPLTSYESVRRKLLSRLPVTYTTSYRSNVIAGSSRGDRRPSKHQPKGGAGGSSDNDDGDDYSSARGPFSCFASRSPEGLADDRKLLAATTGRAGAGGAASGPATTEYLDYGSSAFMWSRVASPPASSSTGSPQPVGPSASSAAESSSSTSRRTSAVGKGRAAEGGRGSEGASTPADASDASAVGGGAGNVNISRRGYREVKTRVVGNVGNHKAFLEPPILDFLMPYILGPLLPKFLAVCPHWFIATYEHILRRASPCLENFKSSTSEHLEFLEAAVAHQKTPIGNNFPRIDILVYARVLPSCSGRTVSLSSVFAYASPSSPFAHPTREPTFPPPDFSPLPDDSEARRANARGLNGASESRPPSSSLSSNSAALRAALPVGMMSDENSILFPDHFTYRGSRGVRTATARTWLPSVQMPILYSSNYRFACSRKGARRDLWVQRDITRFHGDEVLIGSQAFVGNVCVGDIIEIPFVICNAFGFIELQSIQWRSSTSAKIPPNTTASRGGIDLCDLESKNFVWMDLDSYQQTTAERISDGDYFAPQLKHRGTAFTGVDITICRSNYVAEQTGRVSKAETFLGLPISVVESHMPIICSLKRLGLQHDRIAPQQIRIGDTLTLYMTQGGILVDSGGQITSGSTHRH